MLCNSFRFPQLLAKMASSLDVISCGRLEFGIGAGWKKSEYLAYGIPFPSTTTRIEQLREAVTVIKKMWTEDRPCFKGKYYSIKEAICEPKPVQEPHPPIWIGGAGEKHLLRLMAEFADVCSFPPDQIRSLKEYRHKLGILKSHCEKVNRDYSEITKSWGGEVVIAEERTELRKKIERYKPAHMSSEVYIERNIVGTPYECLEKIQKFLELDVTYFVLSIKTLIDDYQLFADSVMKTLK